MCTLPQRRGGGDSELAQRFLSIFLYRALYLGKFLRIGGVTFFTLKVFIMMASLKEI